MLRKGKPTFISFKDKTLEKGGVILQKPNKVNIL